ncbi:MAG: hypothetical protein KDH19_16660 [Geminicoccaceae bacterium]|nr:hypothetical protein [Geminicoccaceae bacterium]MCB2011065.1 hypothetical protein [Geminicoccaceae bacterium]
MTCDPRDLSALSYANGFTLWHYRTGDSVSLVDDAGYFDSAARMLRVGDFIFVNADMDTSASHGVLVVVANDNISVDVTNVVAFGTLNSD